MRTKNLKRIIVFVCLCMIFSYITVYAAGSYSFTYNFKHQLTVDGKKTATKDSADFSIYTTSNSGNDTYFTIEQYKYSLLGSNTYIGSENINCQANQRGSCSFTTTSGTSYTYEFWKPTAIGYVVGSGTLSY